MISQMLAALRDVDGIHGSFVVNKSGVLVGKDLPAMFDDAVLAEVGPRLVLLHDALSASGQALDSCVVKFADHKLHLRNIPHGFLCVLSTNTANTPALRMALTLTARRVDPAITDAPPAVAPVAPAAPAAPRKQFVFRGQKTDA